MGQEPVQVQSALLYFMYLDIIYIFRSTYSILIEETINFAITVKRGGRGAEIFG